MNIPRRIAKNTGFLALANVLSRIMGMFTVMYIARSLGAGDFGVYSFAGAFTGILGIFMDLGLGPLTVREMARDRSLAGRYAVNVSLMKVLSCLVKLMGCPARTVHVVYIIAFSLVFTSFSQIFNSVFQAFERMGYIAFGQIMSGALMLGGVVYVSSRGAGIIEFSLVPVAVSVIVLGYSLTVFRLRFNEKALAPGKEENRRIDPSLCKMMLLASWPFLLSAVVDVIAFRVDMVMLSMMKDDVTVGYYSAAYRFMEFLLFIPATFMGAVYPVLSNYHLSAPESLKRAYERSFRYLAIAGVPLAVGITILAGRIIHLIFKSGYSESVMALKVLSWTIPLIFVTFMYGTVLASINRQSLALKINVISMAANILMNLLLIPKYSLIGSSVATVLTSLLSLVMCRHYVAKFVGGIPVAGFTAKVILASALMGGLVYFMREMGLFTVVLAAAALYFALLAAFRVFSREDYDLIRRAWAGN
jgi:O-antigen/teichoic acid export membrane protein